ncbi:hypothetical protein RFI_25816 [Reticulomyxa filosa]|uniref:Uncharacterized protein n=1 Tax=Reticulomyxa filosa TaxID=46433 RepID=X6MCG6_RETFI|nr:hypothetical protein RFI_25816 [Reticulomyxa filosa]|eukprot:ETO11559.1 hypothetical protein RFI_25816 [Reticulomyxa filosa]
MLQRQEHKQNTHKKNLNKLAKNNAKKRTLKFLEYHILQLHFLLQLSFIFEILKLITPFKICSLPNLFIRSQCVFYKNEIIICGGSASRHTKKRIQACVFLSKGDLLANHHVVKLANNNPNEITLLSFNILFKQAMVMNYVSVCGNDKEIKSKNYNQ